MKDVEGRGVRFGMEGRRTRFGLLLTTRWAWKQDADYNRDIERFPTPVRVSWTDSG
jgi:hypothetical protein